MTATGDTRDEETLIDRLLAEQRELPAVARFSLHADRHRVPAQAKYYRDLIPLSLPKKGQQFAFEVDLDRCSGCKACVTACHNLNGLDDGEVWRSVGSLHGSASRQPGHIHVTTACHHCLDPACLSGCPVLAYEKDSVTGIVHHLDDQCIGCQYCLLKCPYNVPQYHKKKGIVRKCDMCSSRLLANEAPACVQACPNEAIRIGVVNAKQTATEITSATKLVPGAPPSGYTLPTTRYRTDRALERDFSAPSPELKPAPAHSPLAVMLVLTQLSVGLFCMIPLSAFFSGEARELQRLASFVALGCGVLGLGVSVLHLGRPLQAWRAFLGWRTSWLSREIILFGIFVTLAACQVLQSLPAETAPKYWGRWATSVSGLMGVFCSVMVYVDTRRESWRLRSCAGRFFGSTLLLGVTAFVALSLVNQKEVPAAALVALVLISAAKLAWEAAGLAPAFARSRGAARNSAPPNGSDVCPLEQSALLQTGPMRRTTIARFVAGACGGILLPAIVFALPRPDLAAAAACAAFVLCLMGELLERHHFFAAAIAPGMPGGSLP